MQVTTDAAMSPLILCDRAQDADRAGLRGAAEHLLELVGVVLESEATASAQSRFLAKGLLNDNCFDYGGGFGSIV